jgi:hypothetical protein
MANVMAPELAVRTIQPPKKSPITSGEYEIVNERLDGLRVIEDEEDVAPTAYAFDTTRRLLDDVYRILGYAFPRATFSTSQHGGIFIYWMKPGCTVQVTIPEQPDGLAYIHEMLDGQSAGVTEDVTGVNLARSLQRLHLALP